MELTFVLVSFRFVSFRFVSFRFVSFRMLTAPTFFTHTHTHTNTHAHTHVRVFSALHTSGEALAKVSGVAALLRFPLPDLDELDGSDSDSDSDDAPPTVARNNGTSRSRNQGGGNGNNNNNGGGGGGKDGSSSPLRRSTSSGALPSDKVGSITRSVLSNHLLGFATKHSLFEFLPSFLTLQGGFNHTVGSVNQYLLLSLTTHSHTHSRTLSFFLLSSYHSRLTLTLTHLLFLSPFFLSFLIRWLRCHLQQKGPRRLNDTANRR
jgi:hypothetical protein